MGKRKLDTYQNRLLSIFNPSECGKVSRFSTVEAMIKTSMIPIRKGYHEFTSFLGDLKKRNHTSIAIVHNLYNALFCQYYENGNKKVLYVYISREMIQIKDEHHLGFQILLDGNSHQSQAPQPIMMNVESNTPKNILKVAYSIRKSFQIL